MGEWWSNAPPTGTYDMHPFADPYYSYPGFTPQAQAPPNWFSPAMPPAPMPMPAPMPSGSNTTPKVESPREMRNKAEKLRRDTLNQSIAQLASLVPPVVHSTKKVDKIGVLRYTAHYLRLHQYIFDKPPEPRNFSATSANALLGLLKGFMLATTYTGLIVVVSQNIKDYLGYVELELLGKSVFDMIHKDDHEIFRDQIMPRSQAMGRHGELLVPSNEEAKRRMEKRLNNEKRLFLVRFLKIGNRNEPSKYVTCHVEGSFRISDRAWQGQNRTWVRRTRARGENPCNSGNDVVFVGFVRPCVETFIKESALEYFQLEYRTRHSIDGEIIQCEQRISLVTGYMMGEVSGVNAMNFIHRDEVRWVIIALKEMYNQNQLYGESCYRLVTKTGQFIYMRTRGRLDVDPSSRSATSFVCTNTVVDEIEGKELIRMMKERYRLQALCDGLLMVDESIDSQAVEDPKQLKEVILNMVMTLLGDGSNRGDSPSPIYSLITNKRERIVSAIEKIYTVFKTIPGSERRKSEPNTSPLEYQQEETNEVLTPYTNPVEIPMMAPMPMMAPIPMMTPMPIMTPMPEMNPMTMMTPVYRADNNGPAATDMFYQGQAASDAGYNSEYSPVMTSDYGSASGSAMTSSHEEMEFNELLEAENAVVELTFEMVNDEDPTTVSSTPSTSTAGVKRPNLFENQENISKKKVTVTTETAEQETNDDTPVLETFFDEATLNAHIQSAMETMGQGTFEENLRDFLSSNEVENLLDEADNDQTENNQNQM